MFFKYLNFKLKSIACITFVIKGATAAEAVAAIYFQLIDNEGIVKLDDLVGSYGLSTESKWVLLSSLISLRRLNKIHFSIVRKHEFRTRLLTQSTKSKPHPYAYRLLHNLDSRIREL